MSGSKITERLMAAKNAGRKGLIPFLPAGFPDRDSFFAELRSLDEAGADVIEIGVPFSDPVADGPVVEQASLDCLERGVCLSWLLGELSKRKGEYKAALVLMGYHNPFLKYGFERLAEDAADAGVSGFIVPDMPFEESDEFREALNKRGLDLIPLVGLNTPPERMKLYAGKGSGFLYFVSVLGTTGMRDSLPDEIMGKLKEVKEIFDLPVALGFGIKTPAQLENFGDLVDAVVFGSSLIQHIREGGHAGGFMGAWR